tara:strand:- start:150 stop:1310 length:1161 start_codon:yes stop_codon:yes gene_type:complete
MFKTSLNYALFIVLLLLGSYLSIIGGYGSDEDTLPLIGAYESMMSGEQLMASRFTPYPVAELGIGFLSYNLGSAAANIITFIFLIVSLLLFYLALVEKVNKTEFFLFLFLCLSNPILYFDNLEPMDYSWAFLPLAFGAFTLKKNFLEFAVVLFGIAIGTRIYFLVFVFIIIFFFNYKISIDFKRKLLLFILSWFIGGLFYLPIWFENGFALNWLTAVTPSDQGAFGLIARFFYKLVMSFSLLSFISIFIFLGFYYYKSKQFKSNGVLLGLIFSNLVIFFFIPAEMSYLQPMIISFFLLMAFNIKQLYVYLVIFLNFFSWFIEIEPLKIKYLNEDKCNNVQAISAEFDLKLKKGRYFYYLDTRDKIKCWVDVNTIRGKKILEGKALK